MYLGVFSVFIYIRDKYIQRALGVSFSLYYIIIFGLITATFFSALLKQNKQNIHSGYPELVRAYIIFDVFLKHCYMCLVNHVSALFSIVSVFTVLLKKEYISKIHWSSINPFFHWHLWEIHLSPFCSFQCFLFSFAVI